jgi:hypothetical protein
MNPIFSRMDARSKLAGTAGVIETEGIHSFLRFRSSAAP